MSTKEQVNYIINKYEEWNISANDKDIWFNPTVDPNNGYIPICSQCGLDYDNFKSSPILEDMQVEMKHPNSCLWYDWFLKKIRLSCPSAKIVVKKKTVNKK
jgi:hypothetical protein